MKQKWFRLDSTYGPSSILALYVLSMERDGLVIRHYLKEKLRGSAMYGNQAEGLIKKFPYL